ncbi:hypothetical protein SAMN04489712_11382 [Thermomonospora echinospora]|uniref:Methylamine utilisation protein MauE domain-containing protein n=1 Tax=Thermomonospora echinospora TaxID=1992 RepID=A0A1H6D6T3_9ACTN|nr:MauE/DoxX family redox-associated membrane protein [Thermomonospora echinospora]SEG80445.1 hypothetical protein SAMN04489712_11382 [Thermomonospora echinospora]
MIEALAGVAAATVAFVLLIAFAEHLLSPRSLPAALIAHGTVPRRLVRPLAGAVTAVEGALAAALVAAVVIDAPRAVLTGILAAAGVVLASYAAYTHRLLRTAGGRAVPCGCSRADTPVSGWVVLRAGVPAALALLTALRADAVVTPAESAVRFAEASIPGLVFAVLLWVLPEAMIDPDRALEGGSHGI